MPWKKPASLSASPRAATNAKVLRRTLTEPERRLWWHLRHRLRVEGSHFRRQVAIDSYIADFCCLGANLIVEVDGGQHGFERALTYDAKRTEVLEAQGFRVLRFSNADVVSDVDMVLDTIFAALFPPPCEEGPGVVPLAAAAFGGATPTSHSSPQGGGEPMEP